MSDARMARLGAVRLVTDHAAAMARRGRLEEAALLLEPVTAHPEAGADVLDLLARIRAQQGRLDDARALWRAALDRAPGEPRFEKALARCGRSHASLPRLGREGPARWPRAALVSVLALVCILGLGFAYWSARTARSVLALRLGELEEQLASSRQGFLDEAGLADLQAAVEAALAGRPEAEGVEARVAKDGVIRLSGEVASLWEVYAVESAAAGLRGVRALDVTALRIAAAYEVRSGDCLWIIAARVYGVPGLWRRLAEINNLRPPYLLRPGDRLIVPGADRPEGRGEGG